VDTCKNFITCPQGTTHRATIHAARNRFPWQGHSKYTLAGKGLPSPPPGGFTLIELILVLVIIGFLTSLVAPAITSTTGLRLKTTVRKLAAGLRLARSQAVISGNTYQVTFDIENGAMTIEQIRKETSYPRRGYEEVSWETGGENRGEEREALQEKDEKKIYKLPEQVTLARLLIDGREFSEGEVVIEFYPNGSCSGGDIFVMDTRERTLRISLEFLTGIVTIREEEDR